MLTTAFAMSSFVAAVAIAQPGPFGETGDIAGCILGDSFDAHLAYSVLPIDPEDDYSYFLLPDGGYVEGEFGYGVVDNAAAISSATYSGPVGGPDPTGVRGHMLHVQRASLGESPIPINTDEIKYRIYPGHDYAATPDSPVFVTIDAYKNTHENYQRIQNYGASVRIMEFIAGGHYINSFQLDDLAALRGDPELIEGAAMLGAVDQSFGAFFLTGKDIPENAWYTIGVLLTVDEEGGARRSIWLRDRETRGLDGAVIARTPVRTSGPHAGERMFSEFDLGLEEGWAQVYPGTEDDPATTDVVEGYGLAMSAVDGPAPYEEGADGNRVGILQYSPLYTYTRVIAGNDPSPSQSPSYVMRDWWLDNYCVRGGRRWALSSCREDFNVDSRVDAADLAELLAAWGDSQPLPLYPNIYSIDYKDQLVSSSDLAEFLASWGACP